MTDRLTALAELIVSIGCNVQPGQVLAITTEPGKEAVTRAIAELAYARGARYVDPWSFDVHIKRSRFRHADAGTLAWVPSWIGDRLRSLAAIDGAWASLSGPVEPAIFDDVDPLRAGLDLLPRVPDSLPLINAGALNWCVVPVPTAGWAAALHPGLEPSAALDRLWEQIAFVLRLDDEDPATAWERRFDVLGARADQLDAIGIDAIRYDGPGTALTVGLLPSSDWQTARDTTRFDVVHASNLPSEEVFTAPDPLRADGYVTSTRPLVVEGGRIDGLRLGFRAGQVCDVQADRGGPILETLLARDDGARRLGELALVDRTSRVGQLGTVFGQTILDENAASHLALGTAYDDTVRDPMDRERANTSAIHVDFMVGSDDVDVTAIRHDGSEVPLLRGGDWQLG